MPNTPEENKAIIENRKKIAAGRLYGYPQERGPAGQALDESKKKFGWASGEGRGWATRVGPDGQIQWKALAKNPGRVAETGGDWFNAPDYAQRGYTNSRPYFAENPNNTWEQYLMNKGAMQGRDQSHGESLAGTPSLSAAPAEISATQGGPAIPANNLTIAGGGFGGAPPAENAPQTTESATDSTSGQSLYRPGASNFIDAFMKSRGGQY